MDGVTTITTVFTRIQGNHNRRGSRRQSSECSACSYRLGKTATLSILLSVTLGLSGFFAKCAGAQSPQSVQPATTIEVALDHGVADGPVSGRLLVLFSKKPTPAPMKGPNWFSPEPFFATDVTDLAPGQSMVVTDAADGYPAPLSQLTPGKYYVQAVLHRSFDFADHNNGPGNFYSPVKQVVVGGAGSDGAVLAKLRLSSTIGALRYDQTAHAKVVSQRSNLLSEFHHRDVENRALVLLPPSYEREPDKRYPVYYEITGFGATIKDLQARYPTSKIAAEGVEFIHVMLTGQCQWGHHVYADSATNGPRGESLVNELIPAIDRQFRTIGKPEARFLGGHSSGGWASLWLQVRYPEKFAGVWSTAPDPVDFRDWQGTNLYANRANVYRTADGIRKPLARGRGRTLLWYDNFTKMDDTLGRGGQIRSFEAVFSPLDGTGLPARCWDRRTGAVDPIIVEAWKKFDISLILNENWETLKEPLAGKIHVLMGTQDTFFLTRATELLAERLKELGSDARIEFIEGRNHFNLINPATLQRINSEMAKRYLQTSSRG